GAPCGQRHGGPGKRGRPPRGERGPSTLRPRGGWTATPALDPCGERWTPVCILPVRRSKHPVTGAAERWRSTDVERHLRRWLPRRTERASRSRRDGTSPARPVHQWIARAWVPGRPPPETCLRG